MNGELLVTQTKTDQDYTTRVPRHKYLSPGRRDCRCRGDSDIDEIRALRITDHETDGSMKRELLRGADRLHSRVHEDSTFRIPPRTNARL